MINSYIGDYYVTDFLGAGGMGEVYLATHQKIGRKAAIKVLTSFDPHSKFTQRFINEARIQASLDHPNIAKLYDFVEFGGRPCIVMEFVDGQTLYERILNGDFISFSEIIRIFQAVVEAIVYIHGEGILHRDIKSNNIKINSKGEIKLLDFGIAKDMFSSNITLDGHYVGTLNYLSPEQIMGKNVNASSDIWALGVLLYEMATGKLPFESPSISELYKKIRVGDYVRASVVCSEIPEEIDSIIARCLKQKPLQRYPSTDALLDELEHIWKDASPPTSKINFVIKMFSSFKENWLLSTSVLFLLVVLIIGVKILIWDDPTENSTVIIRKKNNTEQPIYNDTSSSNLKEVKIDTYDGRADVYIGENRMGQTPYTQYYPIGEKVKISLKRSGYEAKVVQFEVGEINNQYSYSLNRARQ